MENTKKGYTPIMEKPDYRKSKGAKTPSEVQRMQRVPYASAIESIMYAVRCTRPDVLNGGDRWKSCQGKTLLLCLLQKAEYKNFSVCLKRTMECDVWMRKLIDGLERCVLSNKRPMEMLCDNEPAIAITNDLEILKGARHFQRKYHYIREVIQECEIVHKKVHTDDNVADLFTKPMSFNKHYEHAMAIGIVPASSLM
ncbi:hypothetical protein Tco_0815287 [Tanacetum coccineum]